MNFQMPKESGKKKERKLEKRRKTTIKTKVT